MHGLLSLQLKRGKIQLKVTPKWTKNLSATETIHWSEKATIFMHNKQKGSLKILNSLLLADANITW